MSRPAPPPDLAAEWRYPEAFAPAPELEAWLRETFIEPGGPLYNEEHEHLQQAHLGVLWTNVSNRRQGMQVAGTAGIPRLSSGDAWTKARHDFQLAQWFGEKPDFLLTFDAVIASQLDDASFCALVEHELYHCAQAVDAFGSPKFRQTDGRPVFTIRGHDVEEFVGIVRRYGVGAGPNRENVAALVDAGTQVPSVARARIVQACGTCLSV